MTTTNPFAFGPDEAFARGLPIIPVGLDKRPLCAWKVYQTRTPTVAEFARGRARNPAGWALVTGALAGIVILDGDGEAGRNTFAKLGIEPHVRTGSGGLHAYFRHPGFRVKTVNGKSKRALGEKYPGLDIRADGGYAVFSGRNRAGEYVFLRDPEPHPLDMLPRELRIDLGLEQPAAGTTEDR